MCNFIKVLSKFGLNFLQVFLVRIRHIRKLPVEFNNAFYIFSDLFCLFFLIAGPVNHIYSHCTKDKTGTENATSNRTGPHDSHADRTSNNCATSTTCQCFSFKGKFSELCRLKLWKINSINRQIKFRALLDLLYELRQLAKSSIYAALRITQQFEMFTQLGTGFIMILDCFSLDFFSLSTFGFSKEILTSEQAHEEQPNTSHPITNGFAKIGTKKLTNYGKNIHTSSLRPNMSLLFLLLMNSSKSPVHGMGIDNST